MRKDSRERDLWKKLNHSVLVKFERPIRHLNGYAKRVVA